VAILHWPPLFYAAEALWTLASGRSRVGLLTFQALAGSTLAAGIFFVLRIRYGFWIALSSAILFITTPLVQMSTAMISPDLLLGGLVFWAAVAYANAWETRSRRWIVWALAGCAIATHGRGVAFLTVPLLAPLFLKGRNATRLILLLLTLLVFATIPHLFGQAFASTPQGIVVNAAAYLRLLGSALRWPILAAALLGVWTVCRSPQSNTLATVMMATALGCWIFHSLVNAGLANYYLITIVPPLIVLAAAGADQLLHWLARPGWRIPVLAAALCIALVNVTSTAVKKDNRALRLTQDDSIYNDPHKIWLVGGSSVSEGALIAEVALRDSALQHVVLRSSKMLASSSWFGLGYHLRFPDESGVCDFLDEAHVGGVIVRPDDPAPHLTQLMSALLSNPHTWQRVSASDSLDGWDLFKRAGPLPPGPARIEIDMTDKLRTTFRFLE
jgi:Dolichyl-phosphate-mannose-protein mannosyltransferase